MKKRITYISQGNIPSQWAHTFQAMKMAEALAQEVERFELLTQAHWLHFLTGYRFDYEKWYGINHAFKIKRIFMRGIPKQVLEKVRYPAFDAAAIKYCSKLRDNVIYTRSEPAAILAMENHIPTILETHVDNQHHLFEKILAYSTHPQLKGIVTIHQLLKDQFIEGGMNADKIVVWPDAVDLLPFEKTDEKAKLRESLNLPATDFIATYTGHLYDHRGIEDIIQCAPRLPEITFLLVGGWDKDVIKRKKEAEGISNIIFTGFVENQKLPQYLKASDVLLMPYSKRCPTVKWMSPMKLFEYMAARRPIIASDLEAIRLHLSNSHNALFMEADNYESLESCLQEIKHNKSLADKIANNAYENVKQFTWSGRARAILEQLA